MDAEPVLVSAVCAQALEVASETAQAWSRSIALRIHAETLLALEPPRLDQAEEEVRAAIDIQARRECTFDLAWSRRAGGGVCAGRLRPGSTRDAPAAPRAAPTAFTAASG